MVLDKWPETLFETIGAIEPFVAHKVAVVDQTSSRLQLNEAQTSLFDVVEYTRELSFDRLRNESLRLARTVCPNSWALVIDSDEQINPLELVKAHQVIAATTASAFLLPRYNYVGQGRWATTYGFRLFRLDAPILYSYEIHESISPSLIEHGLDWDYLDAPLQHLDFINPTQGKRARYKKLLADAITKGVDLAFLKTLYAIECIWSGEQIEALRHLDEAILFAQDPNLNPRFNGRDDFPMMIKAQALLQGGAPAEAKTLFEKIQRRAEPRVAAEAALGIAQADSATGAQTKALENIEASIALWDTADAVFSRATAYAELDETALALRDLSAGLRRNPMAGSPLIQGPLDPDGVFGLQCLLHPNYRGIGALLQKLF